MVAIFVFQLPDMRWSKLKKFLKNIQFRHIGICFLEH